jgi:hypothetical protein
MISVVRIQKDVEKSGQVLSQLLPGTAEKNHENLLLQQSVFGLRFLTATS